MTHFSYKQAPKFKKVNSSGQFLDMNYIFQNIIKKNIQLVIHWHTSGRNKKEPVQMSLFTIKYKESIRSRKVQNRNIHGKSHVN